MLRFFKNSDDGKMTGEQIADALLVLEQARGNFARRGLSYLAAAAIGGAAVAAFSWAMLLAGGTAAVLSYTGALGALGALGTGLMYRAEEKIIFEEREADLLQAQGGLPAAQKTALPSSSPLARLTTTQLKARLSKLNSGKTSLGGKLGRIILGALGVAAEAGYLSALGLSVTTLTTAAPVLLPLVFGSLAVSAFIGVRLYSLITDMPADIRRKKQEDILKELEIRETSAVPTPASTGATQAAPLPAPVSAAPAEKPKALQGQKQAAPLLTGSKLGEFMAAATASQRGAAPLLNDIDKTATVHEREFGEVFGALAALPETEGRKFIRENSSYAGSGAAPTALTEIYLADPAKPDVAGILQRRKEDRRREAESQPARPDAEQRQDYTDLTRQTQIRISTSAEKIEVRFVDAGSPRPETRKFAARDFTAVRREIASWMTRNTPEFTKHLQPYPATIYKSFTP